MSLPPRAQRQQYLRFEGLEYTDVDIADFEERLGKIYDRGVHRVQVFDFGGLTDLMAEGLSSRMLMEHRDAQGQRISSEGDFLGITPSYTAIRDPMLRLCHSPGTREADAMVGAPEVAKGAPDIDEGAQAVPAPIQAPQPPPGAGPARTLPQKVARLSGVRYTSYFDFRIPYQRRVRRRTGEGSTSAVPLDEDQPDP
ncbi:hypothetical protein Tco_1220159 [Tanacetum coccineum]